MSTEVGTRYSYSHIRAVLDTSTLGEIRSITDPSRGVHRETGESANTPDNCVSQKTVEPITHSLQARNEQDA